MDNFHNITTGGTAYNPPDTEIAGRISEITRVADSCRNRMDRTPGAYLWSDLADTGSSSQITSAYGRLYQMALAYATYGSSLYHNTSLRADIITGLDWMYQNRYYAGCTRYVNWWDWEIGAPLDLEKTMILVNEGLTPTQRANYLSAVAYHCPNINKFNPAWPDSEGANRSWRCYVVLMRGMLEENSTLIEEAVGGLGILFDNVTSGNGELKAYIIRWKTANLQGRKYRQNYIRIRFHF